MKVCPRCKKKQNNNEFKQRYGRPLGQLNPYCKLCRREQAKEFFHRVTKPKREQLRAKVIAKFGGKCAHCSFDDSRVLQIDHVHDDGNVERRNNSSAWASSLTFLRKVLADEQGNYQLLCPNCNLLKRYRSLEG